MVLFRQAEVNLGACPKGLGVRDQWTITLRCDQC
jgi:hypothetical protein